MDELTPSDKAYLLAWEEADKERLNNPDLKELGEANYKDALELLWEGAGEEIRDENANDRFSNLKELESYKANLHAWLKIYKENLLTDVGTFSSKQHNSLRDFISDCQNDLIGKGYRLPSNLGSWGERFLLDYVKIQGHIAERRLDALESEGKDLFKDPGSIKSCSPLSASTRSHEPLFSELYSNFIQYKVSLGLSERMQAEYCRSYDDWEAIMPDKRISEYTKREFLDFILVYKNLPKRNLTRYKGKSIPELLEMDTPEEDLLMPRKMIETRKWLQGIYHHAVQDGFIDYSPVKNLKLDVPKSKPYAPYSQSEMKTILLSVTDDCKRDWQKWVVMIAAYTGMRRSEIVQLKGADFLFDAETERHYFLIKDLDPDQSVKTDASFRQIPIHPKLIDAGILSLKLNPNERVFPGLLPNSVTTWFTEQLKPSCGISKFNDYGQRKVFHSFRHTVITRLLSHGISHIQVQELVGHEKTLLGVTGVYAHRFSIKELALVMDTIDYG